MTIENWFGIAMVFLLGILGMRLFRNVLLQLLSFLIPVMIAASLAGFLDLVQSVTAAILVLTVVVIALVVIIGYKLLRQIVQWVNQQLGQ